MKKGFFVLTLGLTLILSLVFIPLSAQARGTAPGKNKIMKMIAAYKGDGIYVVQDMMFYDEGNFYEIEINNEKIGEMTVKPAANSRGDVKPGWTPVKTTKHRFSYKVSPDKRKKGDPIIITLKIRNKDAGPVENARVVLDMAMKMATGEVAMAMDMGMDMGSMAMPGMPMKMYMPIIGMGAHVLPPGKIRVEVHFTEMNDDEVLDNGSEVHKDMSMRMTRVLNEFYYGLPKDMHLRLVIPYVDYKMTGFMPMGGVKGEATGLGDISMVLKKRLYMKDGWSFAVSGGIKLPTGKDDAKFTDRNMATKAFYDDYRMSLDMQPGTGTFDPLLGAALSKSDRLGSWHANAMYRYIPKGDEDVDPGDILMFNVARNLAINDSLTLVFEANGMDREDDKYPGRTPWAGYNEHGLILNLTPGFQVHPAEWVTLEGAVKIPVITPDDGIIPGPMPFVGANFKF
jgi:hypothetical protein